MIAGLSGLLERDWPTILVEFWVDGMRARGLDPQQIAAGYGQTGYKLSLLGDDARLRVVTPPEVVAAAEADASRHVNIVLQRG